VLDELKRRAVSLAQGEATADGLDCEIAWVEEFPVTVNHARSVVRARRAARAAGLEIARPLESPFRWSEDFGWFLRETPGTLVGLGAGEDQPVLHAQDYDFPDALLPLGVRFYEALLSELGLR
jgi:metal-dependent amidase/aminoacylase/carboxypeptidase family protein